MKIHWIVLIPLGLLTGCASLTSENYLVRNGSLASQPMLVVTRPQEFGLETLGDAKGSASVEKFLFFTIAGDKPDATLPIIGKQSRNPLETLACFRAAQSKGGDAFYAISSEWEKMNFLFLYRKQAVTVTGKSLKVKDLGPLTTERADMPINRTASDSDSIKKPGLIRRILGIFSL